MIFSKFVVITNQSCIPFSLEISILIRSKYGLSIFPAYSCEGKSSTLPHGVVILFGRRRKIEISSLNLKNNIKPSVKIAKGRVSLLFKYSKNIRWAECPGKNKIPTMIKIINIANKSFQNILCPPLISASQFEIIVTTFNYQLQILQEKILLALGSNFNYKRVSSFATCLERKTR